MVQPLPDGALTTPQPTSAVTRIAAMRDEQAVPRHAPSQCIPGRDARPSRTDRDEVKIRRHPEQAPATAKDKGGRQHADRDGDE